MKSLDSLHDYKLVDAYLKGDENSGKILYGSNYIYVKKFIAKKMQKSLEDELVHDVLNETMLRSVDKLDTFNGKSRFSTWLCGIAFFVIKEFYKKATKDKKIDYIEDSEDHDIVDESSLMGRNPINVLIEKERRDCIKNSIKEMKPEYQDIVHLRVVNRVPVKQVAALSNESESAIDSRQRRAIAKLREIIKKNDC